MLLYATPRRGHSAQEIGRSVYQCAVANLPHMLQASNSKLFRLAKVGLGCLGVVIEVTLQCVPAHELLEHTFVVTSDELRRRHAGLLQNNKHVRYMWIPYTHDVVVVTNNPLQKVPFSGDDCSDKCFYISNTSLMQCFCMTNSCSDCTLTAWVQPAQPSALVMLSALQFPRAKLS